MKIVADLHTHTIGSTHAYSTLIENCVYARRAGLSAIAMTDHGTAAPDSPHPYHFSGLANVVPRYIEDVFVFRGIECNFTDENGTIDFLPEYEKAIDFVIASAHKECISFREYEVLTNMYIESIRNHKIDMLGHIDHSIFTADYERLIPECARLGVIVEINAASFRYRGEKSIENIKKIIKIGKKNHLLVAACSDAHIATSIGDVAPAIELLEEMGYPHELIVNGSEENLKKYFKEKRNLEILC